MSVGQPLQDIALVEVPSGAFGSPSRPGSAGGPAKAQVPQNCVLLRAGGLLSMLDMEQGTFFGVVPHMTWTHLPHLLGSCAS